MLRQFGLIGYPLSHSFSKRYFSEKFIKEGIADAYYELFPLPDIELLPILLSRKTRLRGLNVTIPHKQAIMPFLHRLDESAARVGAVNVVKITPQGEYIGYNSDYYGFKISLENTLKQANLPLPKSALILGTGGASKAVAVALADLQISFRYVSRTKKNDADWLYEEITSAIVNNNLLIVNTTPLGMSPDLETAPPIPYQHLSQQHLLFDLVYNPAETLFLRKGKEAQAHTKNGLEMLHLQAEKAWQIWNE